MNRKNSLKNIARRYGAACLGAVLLLTSASVGLTGCGMDTEISDMSREMIQEEEQQTYLYQLNEDGDCILRSEYSFEQPDTEGRITEMVAKAAAAPEDTGKKSLLPENTTIKVDNLTDGILTLQLSGAMKGMRNASEVLTIGGLVRTFIQIDGVDGVAFKVNGGALKDSYGKELGVFTESSFVENSGKTINTYLSASMTLYFTDQTGTYLVPEIRKVYYSSNESLEQAVLEELIRGPKEEGHYPVLAADSSITSVIPGGDVCYVNFGKSIDATSLLSVSAEIPIYAVVDSLAVTCNTEKVQISINGESDMLFRNKMDLKQTYEKNMDLILR